MENEMNKKMPEKVNRYMEVMRQLREAKDSANTSTSGWAVIDPWTREGASEVQKHIRDMIVAKQAEVNALQDAWCEFIEMVDDRCVEEYAEFTYEQMKKHAEAMRLGAEHVKKEMKK
jgi:hypothetical protein